MSNRVHQVTFHLESGNEFTASKSYSDIEVRNLASELAEAASHGDWYGIEVDPEQYVIVPVRTIAYLDVRLMDRTY